MEIPFKRGDTFLIQGQVLNGVTPVDITGWSIRANVMSGNTLIANLEVEYVDRPTGLYRLRKNHNAVSQPTTGWPVRDLTCDIEYTTSAPQVVSTETFTIKMTKDETV